jgi:hypothetical protein
MRALLLMALLAALALGHGAAVDAVVPLQCAECELTPAKPPPLPEARPTYVLKSVWGPEMLTNHQLGLAPVMSVDTPTLRHAVQTGQDADSKHQKFIDDHAINCAGPICPFADKHDV